MIAGIPVPECWYHRKIIQNIKYTDLVQTRVYKSKLSQYEPLLYTNPELVLSADFSIQTKCENALRLLIS